MKLFKLLMVSAMMISTVAFADMPMISDMRVMASPPGAKVTAGFLTINNMSSSELIITGVTSDTIPRIEVHESVIKDDVATMVKHNELSIAAGEMLELKHGGFHLMLMDLTEPVVAGKPLSITLHTSQGDIKLDIPVKMPGSHGADASKSHKNH